MRMLDTSRAVLWSAAAIRPARFWAPLVQRLKNRLNRSVVTRLDGFTDHELADIGLTRLDVQSALSTTRFFEDPSRKLASVARGRRHP